MLDVVISNEQFTFVPGRLISINVIIGFECIHSTSNNTREKVENVAMKMDMSKAYNHVELIYLS